MQSKAHDEKLKCVGCGRIIKRKPGSRKRKYCTWGCYAYQMAPSWGMSRKNVKRLDLIRISRIETLTKAHR